MLRITLRPIEYGDMAFLLMVLRDRPKRVSISHRKLPTFEEHCAFWGSNPYEYAAMIVVEDYRVGYCYISRNNEIGIHLLKHRRRLGIGSQVFHALMARTDGRGVANISQHNKIARKFLKSMGLRQAQETYVVGGG